MDAQQANPPPTDSVHALAASDGKRAWAAYNVIQRRGSSSRIWSRIGSAWLNRDGSITLVLDSFPIGGRIHLREDRDSGRSVQQGALAFEAARGAERLGGAGGPQMCAPLDPSGGENPAVGGQMCAALDPSGGENPAVGRQMCAAPTPSGGEHPAVGRQMCAALDTSGGEHPPVGRQMCAAPTPSGGEPSATGAQMCAAPRERA